MIWVILAFLGVPLWLIAVGILVVFFDNRRLRQRDGNIPVRVKRPGKRRWRRGHAIWVSDVFAWRGSPAAWTEDLEHVAGVTLRSPDPEERKKLHRLGDGFVIATMTPVDGGSFGVAVRSEAREAILGPFPTPGG
jgi:hypothetical protein